MRHFFPISLLVLGSAAVAQPGDRRFDVPGFDTVELVSSDTIRIVPGATSSVTATGDPRAVASLAIDVREGTLRVGRTPGRHYDRGAVVTVRMPALRAMTLSGSGTIAADGVEGDSVAARLSGSGQLNLPNIHVRKVRLVLDGSGSITASGQADQVDIDAGGSGRVEAAGLETSKLAVDLGGSGSVSATSASAASIKAGGSGNVRVMGHPACAVSKSGTARVTCG